MLTTIPFDTHAYVKKLQAVGFTEGQAEVQAQALAELVNDQLATKRDLKELEVTLRREFESSRADLKRDLKELELRITVRLGALITAGVAAVVILDKVLK